MRTDVDATLRLRHCSGVGWWGILTFMYHAYRRGCYAAATSLVRGWVRWGGILMFMYHAYRRGCYAAATSLVRSWVGWGGILTFMYHPYTICFMKLAITLRASPASPKKKTWGNLLVHTGGIDGMWKISKGAVSSSWSTRKDGAANPQLLQGIRIWQWRWHHGNSTGFLSLTGRALSKRLEK